MNGDFDQARPDFRGITTWLFDLDNTLYPLSSGLAERVSERITDFVGALTGLPPTAAHALQKRYLVEHGLTLRGLMLHHGVDPAHYHAHLAQVSLDCLAGDPGLRDALLALPGRRIVFTNADEGHAERVLARLGLEAVFDAVFHIGSGGYLPKPSPESFARLVEAHALDPAATAFFDDISANLEPAAALGMTTVLVGPAAEGSCPGVVHRRAPTLAPFLRQVTAVQPEPA